MKKTIERNIDLIVLSVAFVIVGIYVVDYILSVKLGLPPAERWGALHWHMLGDCVLQLLFALTLLWCVRRFSGCLFSWIASISFLSLVSISTAYYILLFPYRILLIVGSTILFGGMALMFISYVLRLCLKKFGITSSRY